MEFHEIRRSFDERRERWLHNESALVQNEDLELRRVRKEFSAEVREMREWGGVQAGKLEEANGFASSKLAKELAHEAKERQRLALEQERLAWSNEELQQELKRIGTFEKDFASASLQSAQNQSVEMDSPTNKAWATDAVAAHSAAYQAALSHVDADRTSELAILKMQHRGQLECSEAQHCMELHEERTEMSKELHRFHVDLEETRTSSSRHQKTNSDREERSAAKVAALLLANEEVFGEIREAALGCTQLRKDLRSLQIEVERKSGNARCEARAVSDLRETLTEARQFAKEASVKMGGDLKMFRGCIGEAEIRLCSVEEEVRREETVLQREEVRASEESERRTSRTLYDQRQLQEIRRSLEGFRKDALRVSNSKAEAKRTFAGDQCELQGEFRTLETEVFDKVERIRAFEIACKEMSVVAETLRGEARSLHDELRMVTEQRGTSAVELREVTKDLGGALESIEMSARHLATEQGKFQKARFVQEDNLSKLNNDGHQRELERLNIEAALTMVQSNIRSALADTEKKLEELGVKLVERTRLFEAEEYNHKRAAENLALRRDSQRAAEMDRSTVCEELASLRDEVARTRQAAESSSLQDTVQARNRITQRDENVSELRAFIQGQEALARTLALERDQMRESSVSAAAKRKELLAKRGTELRLALERPNVLVRALESHSAEFERKQWGALEERDEALSFGESELHAASDVLGFAAARRTEEIQTRRVLDRASVFLRTTLDGFQTQVETLRRRNVEAASDRHHRLLRIAEQFSASPERDVWNKERLWRNFTSKKVPSKPLLGSGLMGALETENLWVGRAGIKVHGATS